MQLVDLNFHHLQYFWAVAKSGNLTQTATMLRVSQSAVSSQIKQLEDQLGQPLFVRSGRRLVLNEAGKIALVYAERIFDSGGELMSTLRAGRRRQHTLRVGAVATLSRNFQRSFVRPLLGQSGVRFQLISSGQEDLLAKLEAHTLDVVLSHRSAPAPFRSLRLARQPVSIVWSRRVKRFDFPRDLKAQQLILPGPTSSLRSEFDALCEKARVRYRIFAEVDDMAMIRLLARDSGVMALVPSVVVRDELREGRLHELCVVPDVAESFYAITPERRYPHPLLVPLLTRDAKELLEVPSDDGMPPRRGTSGAR